jgi:hypothetical protein
MTVCACCASVRDVFDRSLLEGGTAKRGTLMTAPRHFQGAFREELHLIF